MKSIAELRLVPILLAVVLAIGCAAEEPAETAPEDELLARANIIFKPLPREAPSADNPVTRAKVDLGKRLYCRRAAS
jgi:hypothetical protein